MSQQTGMKAFADNVGKYIYEKFVAPKMAQKIGYFRAEVTSAASGGKITVQRPFDTTSYALPYVGSAASLAVGDQCIVMVLGTMSNAIILGDGRLSNL